MDAGTVVPAVVAVASTVVCLWLADRLAPRFGGGKGVAYVLAVAIVVGLTVIAGYMLRS